MGDGWWVVGGGWWVVCGAWRVVAGRWWVVGSGQGAVGSGQWVVRPFKLGLLDINAATILQKIGHWRFWVNSQDVADFYFSVDIISLQPFASSLVFYHSSF